jgi:hypothetical protein
MVKSPFRIIGDEQILLMTLSRMYDNIYENPDRPDELVINDDDMLDGWLLVQKKKREQEAREATKEIMERRHGNAGEIFIMADTEDDIKDIEKMNDARARVIKHRIEQAVQSNRTVKDLDILELRTEAEQKARGK